MVPPSPKLSAESEVKFRANFPQVARKFASPRKTTPKHNWEKEEAMSGYSKKHAQSGVKAKLPRIECFLSQYKNYEVNISIPEFTCICPKTGLPDFATIRIEYSPDKHCVELKSFKLYITAYRNVGIFHEHAVNKILEDFAKACLPRRAHIKMAFNPRGGITTTVEAEYNSNEKNK